MFSALRENNPIYLLYKGGKKPELRIGTVVGVSSPVPKTSMQYPPETEVSITARFGDEQVVFEHVDSNLTIKEYKPGVVISESREAMANEVDTMMRSSQMVLDSIDYHTSVVETCESMLKELSPRFAKEKENDERLDGFERKLDALGKNMEEMMSIFKSLNKNKKEQ
jgi:hypothetical protein